MTAIYTRDGTVRKQQSNTRSQQFRDVTWSKGIFLPFQFFLFGLSTKHRYEGFYQES
jgi:hypothetical protein